MKIFLALLLPVFVVSHPGISLAQFSDTYELIKAVEDNDITKARSMLFAGANVNARKDGSPALMIAIKNRNFELARLLLDNGAYINMENLPQQETSLMAAAVAGDEEAVRLLIEYHADLNAPDRFGQTALMKSAAARKENIVRILIESGADIYQTDYVGRDALQYAKEARARSIIKLLEDAGAR